MNEREIELERRFENLKTALQEYVDYVEYIKKVNAAPKKRKPSPPRPSATAPASKSACPTPSTATSPPAPPPAASPSPTGPPPVLLHRPQPHRTHLDKKAMTRGTRRLKTSVNRRSPRQNGHSEDESCSLQARAVRRVHRTALAMGKPVRDR